MMRTLLIALLMMFSAVSFAYAEIGVCHDGTGKITVLEPEANYVFFRDGGRNCRFFTSEKPAVAPVVNEIMLPDAEYKALRLLLSDVNHRYFKFNIFTERLVEMTQQEKDDLDASLISALKTLEANNINPEIEEFLEFLRITERSNQTKSNYINFRKARRGV